MSFDNLDSIVRRQMVVFFLVDTSGSMDGTKIGAVNQAMREVLPELKGIGGSDVDLKIAVLGFSNGCKWLQPAPISVDDFQWKNLNADGITDLGAACRELSNQMSKERFLKAKAGSVAPAIFLMSDGEPTDDYQGGIKELKKNNWFKYAIKVAVAIGEDANQDALAEFTGNKEAVITVHNPEQLKKWIKFISVTSSQIGSKSQPVADNGEVESKQKAVIDAIAEEQIHDPESVADVDTQEGW